MLSVGKSHYPQHAVVKDSFLQVLLTRKQFMDWGCKNITLANRIFCRHFHFVATLIKLNVGEVTEVMCPCRGPRPYEMGQQLNSGQALLSNTGPLLLGVPRHMPNYILLISVNSEGRNQFESHEIDLLWRRKLTAYWGGLPVEKASCVSLMVL